MHVRGLVARNNEAHGATSTQPSVAVRSTFVHRVLHLIVSFELEMLRGRFTSGSPLFSDVNGELYEVIAVNEREKILRNFLFFFLFQKRKGRDVNIVRNFVNPY